MGFPSCCTSKAEPSSFAAVDAGGLLSVGPHGAGARPGPACYGLGGEDPTVTDAHLILGRMRAGKFAGGVMPSAFLTVASLNGFISMAGIFLGLNIHPSV